MPVVNAWKDGYCLNIGEGATWPTVRDATTSSGGNTSAVNLTVDSVFITGRGPNLNAVARSFINFDTSGISDAVSSATLKLYALRVGGPGSPNNDFIVVKGTQSGDPATSDFDSMTGWSTGSSDGAGAGDNESNVTKYSAEIDDGDIDTTGYFDVPLTAQARTDMENDSVLNIAILNYTYDLKDIQPGGGAFTSINFWRPWSTDKGAGYLPYIDYTLAGAAVTHNATLFGTNF